MSSQRWQRIKEIVDAALDREPSARARYLDDVCEDSGIRAEVESLLAHETEGFLEQPAVSELGLSDEDFKPAAVPVDLHGRIVSHYRIEHRIGAGGMGEVFLAQDQELDRRVALKLLAEDLEQDESAAQRFMREAKSAAALDHPYICKIYEIGEAERKPFIAMEYVEGETLAERIKRGALTLPEVLRIASEIAEALVAAHREHIVHRDLKPANIMLTVGGHVKVLDFGLAKRVANPEGALSQFETASLQTGTGLTLGTLAYMSPEQLRGQRVDGRSDIFSFGIVLFEMLAGAHPFDKATPVDAAAAILNEALPPLARHGDDVPESLRHIVAKMLEKDANDRYQQVGAVRSDLERVEPTGAAPGPPLPPSPVSDEQRSPLSRIVPLASRGRRIALAVVVAATLIGGVWAWRSMWSGSFPFAARPPSVAILPLINIGGDPQDDYLAEGISRAVAKRLNRVGLQVTSWDTSWRYGADVRPADAVARELNVDAVLKGTFRISDDGYQLSVTVALIEAQGGFESWGDWIVAPYEEVFDVQTRIARGVATTLVGRLTPEEEGALAVPESRDFNAYDYYVTGARPLMEGTVEGADLALGFFDRAMELDPDLAAAHAGAGAVHAARYDYGEGGLENLELAEIQLDEALRLKPGDMMARRDRISTYYYMGQSEECLTQGLEAKRARGAYDAEALLVQAQAYLLGGLADLSVPLIHRVVEMEPANEAAQRYLTVAHAWRGELDQSVAAGEAYLAKFADALDVRTTVAQAHHALGSDRQARAHYERAVELARQTGSPSGVAARAFLYAGMFFDQHSERALAQELWREGLNAIENRPNQGVQDNPGILLYRAMFERLLDQKPSDSMATEVTLDVGFVPYQLVSLAATYAALDQIDLAAQVLERALRLGSMNPGWKLNLSVASPSALESEALRPFVEQYETRERELRQLY